MTIFHFGASKQRVVLEGPVVQHLEAHRQITKHHREAGGQLFATFAGGDVVIREATGPRRTDQRTRTSYCADRKAEQREILEHHQRGLHYVGDWHTHPSEQPTPSQLDYLSIQESVRKSNHDLEAFVLIVVGTLPLLEGLHVSVNTADSTIRLQRIDEREIGEADLTYARELPRSPK